MSKGRPWVWAWTIPAALIGWLATGALLPGTIPACGWEVIESGIVSERVWDDHRSGLAFQSAIAVAWVLAYSFWARCRNHAWPVDVLVCFGFGATAWAFSWVALGYTFGDHWSEGKPLDDIPPLGEGYCGIGFSTLGVILVDGGFVAIVGWVVLALFAAQRAAKIQLGDDALESPR